MDRSDRRCRFLTFAGVLAATLPAPALAQESGDQAVRKVLASRAADLEREFLPDLKTAEDFNKARPMLREAYFRMLGLWPLPERTPLEAKVTGRLEEAGCIIEKLHFQSRPGLYVTANLYLPGDAKGPLPAILYLCGHYRKQKRDGAKSECQDRGIWFATHGYACLIPDTLELGEIQGVHQGTCPGPVRPKRWWWLSAGYTPAGVECWNAIRAIDYLVSRPEVDPERIGATGISGGGGATFWIAAADERVRAAAPVSGMADLGFYVAESGVDVHCDCMLFYNSARWNWTTIAALAAPRPLLFVNSDNDVYFPMSANERVINRLERLYSRFGASDRVDHLVSVGKHDYRSDIRRGVFEFFNRHLKGDARRVADPDAGLTPEGRHRIEYRKLRVFPEDADIPADQQNTKIDRAFVPLANPELPSAEGFEAWRRDLLDRLKTASFGGWPATAPAVDVPPLAESSTQGRELTEEGLEVHWRWHPGKAPEAPRWLIVLNPGEDSAKLPPWARDVVGEGSVLLLHPRGTGPGAWAGRNLADTVQRSMALLGTTVDAGRTWDVLTAIRRRAGPWRVAGRGPAGIIAAYAALYELSIEGVVAVQPPPSHRPEREGAEYGPVFLDALRVLDIPEALGCLAPRPLSLVDAPSSAFNRTATLYRLSGAEARLERK